MFLAAAFSLQTIGNITQQNQTPIKAVGFNKEKKCESILL
jgi:hypothetical protein